MAKNIEITNTKDRSVIYEKALRALTHEYFLVIVSNINQGSSSTTIEHPSQQESTSSMYNTRSADHQKKKRKYRTEETQEKIRGHWRGPAQGEPGAVRKRRCLDRTPNHGKDDE